MPLVLGLDGKDIALLALTFLVSTIGAGSGRTNMMLGVVPLVIFAAFPVSRVRALSGGSEDAALQRTLRRLHGGRNIAVPPQRP